MRVLFVTAFYKPAVRYGGPIQSTAGLCAGLRQIGVDAEIYTTNADGAGRLDVPLGRTFDVDGVPVRYHHARSTEPFFYAPDLVRAVSRRLPQVDVVVLDALFSHALGPVSRACLAARVPYVVPLHGQLLPWALSQRASKKWIYLRVLGSRCLERAAAVHCTHAVESEAFQRLGIRARSIVVPNGVDVGRFENAEGRLRSSLGLTENAIILLFLGRIHRKKRPDLAVDVLLHLLREGHDAHLVLAGPDEEGLTLALRERAREAGAAARYHVIGTVNQDDVPATLADADLMLMPSEPDSENFGMSAVEALAAGLVLVASTGVPVAADAQGAGAAVQVPCDAARFSEAASSLISDPARMASMRAAALVFARNHYDLPVVATCMRDSLAALIANTSMPSVTP